MERAAAGSAAEALAATARDDLNYGERLKLQLAVLQKAFPGWQVWYVPLHPNGERWCAKPGDSEDNPQIEYADSAEDLAEAVGKAIAGGAP